MDADFEQHYQAAERAYGLGELRRGPCPHLSVVGSTPKRIERARPSLVLGWRWAVVSLLLGHIQLHGLRTGKPPSPTNGCCRVTWTPPSPPWRNRGWSAADQKTSPASQLSPQPMTPATNGAIPDLLKDPLPEHFLPIKPGQHRLMWSPQCRGCPVMKNPGPCRLRIPLPLRLLLCPSPQSQRSPQKPIQTPRSRQEMNPCRRTTNNCSEEEPPVAVDPTPQEPAAKDLLENSWLRVQLQPDIKSPTDSVEPMGLINRIKGVFVRSAGR